ncbi:hypothetical protein BCR34DRAFT_161510 [Clohesyomyces aquaticus]|uniref:Uncharacterized protein n=1 Tax=Clohesyomyces aquaticus TaxID=1231657 RepID=A0A1Y1ZZU4_9PLEO|nr:hypothetical protein BCR34DRAFT_161510 [Clohesyomyces aquaticus]
MLGENNMSTDVVSRTRQSEGVQLKTRNHSYWVRRNSASATQPPQHENRGAYFRTRRQCKATRKLRVGQQKRNVTPFSSLDGPMTARTGLRLDEHRGKLLCGLYQKLMKMSSRKGFTATLMLVFTSPRVNFRDATENALTWTTHQMLAKVLRSAKTNQMAPANVSYGHPRDIEHNVVEQFNALVWCMVEVTTQSALAKISVSGKRVR